jgi:CRP/FNR family transcriptional regulator, anaerobic regulatory protein
MFDLLLMYCVGLPSSAPLVNLKSNKACSLMNTYYQTQLDELTAAYGKEAMDAILQESIISGFPGDTELFREGQYIKAIPIVLEGIVKVFAGESNKEILLYYVQPGESCIMSFAACLNNEKSKAYAVTQSPVTAILLPGEKLAQWLVQFPLINRLFYQQYNQRYTEMIETVQHLLFDKLDKRLYDYLKGKQSVTGKNPIKISHREIAKDLGTAREVISRLVKRMEHQHKVKQYHDSIEIVDQ